MRSEHALRIFFLIYVSAWNRVDKERQICDHMVRRREESKCSILLGSLTQEVSCWDERMGPFVLQEEIAMVVPSKHEVI